LIDGGYVPAALAGASPGQAGAALAARIAQLRHTYPSREEYRKFWRTQPHFPPADWSRWVEALLDYEVAGESPVQPKASEVGVIADMAEVVQREAVVERLKSIRVPTILLRAEKGFVPDQAPLLPDELAAEIRSYVPQVEDHKFSGTTHYTIVLGEDHAARTADVICGLAERLQG